MLKNISWSRGFFRLWLLYGLFVVIILGGILYDRDWNGLWDYLGLGLLLLVVPLLFWFVIKWILLGFRSKETAHHHQGEDDSE